MRHPATRRPRATPLSQTTVVPGLRQPAAENSSPKISEKEVAAKFAGVVTAFSKDDLAGVSGRTAEAAKHWKAASRAPNSSSLINMARRLPVVRDWVISEIDRPLPATEDPGEALKVVMAGLQLAAHLPGEQGAQARAMLLQLSRAVGI